VALLLVTALVETSHLVAALSRHPLLMEIMSMDLEERWRHGGNTALSCGRHRCRR
jgi:hypothetical protein